jgi:hypothetical protein
MKTIAFSLSVLLAVASARPLAQPVGMMKREVPQEQSHKKFLDLVNTSLKVNNPDEIVDAVFGLLGNAAGSKGQGKITDTGMSM